MFGRFSQLTDIIRFLMSIKSEDISAVLASVKVFQTEADIKAKVLAGIQIAEIAATYTPTTQDDEFIGWIKMLSQEDLVWKLVDMVQDLLDGKDIDPVKATFGAEQDVKGVPVVVIIQVAMFIAQLIRDWRKDK
jgi:hypothetical protein